MSDFGIDPTTGHVARMDRDARTEAATAFTRNGLTYASLNGREVAPDLLVTHASVSPTEAAWELARLRSQRAGARLQDLQPDLEWDPPAPGERVPDERKVTWE